MEVLLAFVKIKSYNDSLGERYCTGKTEDMYLLCKIEVNSVPICDRVFYLEEEKMEILGV